MSCLFDEIWKDIPNYKGYQVSNYGRIRTFNKITYTKRHGIRKWKDRIIKQKKQTRKHTKHNDYKVELWNNGQHKTFLVARLVGFTFYNEDINNKNLTINHKDGNSENNKLENLEIISIKENINHGYNNGLYSNRKKVKVIDKYTNEEKIYRSMSKADEGINKKMGYISLKIKRNKFENEQYRWELINDRN